MQWNIRDVEPSTKARIKAYAAIHGVSIGDALTLLIKQAEDTERTAHGYQDYDLTGLRGEQGPKPPTLLHPSKDIAKKPLEVNSKSHNYS